MQLTISREVIQSIKLARDFQLAAVPEAPDMAALAKLGFNNGHRAELTLNIKKLSAWARTFKPEQIPNGLSGSIEEIASDYSVLWLRAQHGDQSSLIKFCSGGHVFADPIEIEIKDGVAQIVPAPGGETELKAIRAIARLEVGRQRIAKQVNKIKGGLHRSQNDLRYGQKKHDEAAAYLAEHSFEDALTEAKTLRDKKRHARRINVIIDVLVNHRRPEGFKELKKKERVVILDALQAEIRIEAEEIKRELLTLGVLQSEAVTTSCDYCHEPLTEYEMTPQTRENDAIRSYSRACSTCSAAYGPTLYWPADRNSQFDAAYLKLSKAILARDQYCSKSWKSTGLEQRMKAVKIAHNDFRRAANLYEYLYDLNRRGSYQSQRVTVRRWPLKLAQLESQIAGFEQELILKGEELGRLENPPVKTARAAAKAKKSSEVQPEPTPVPQPTGDTIMPTASPATDAITLTFTKEKETKNTIKFEEDERDGQPKLVGSLYLQKFVAKASTKLTVTIAIQ